MDDDRPDERHAQLDRPPRMPTADQSREPTAPRVLPEGEVTLLFTDIEGSTRLLHKIGDLYGEVLAEHYKLLREIWQRHDGLEVDTEGDAFFVAFPYAAAAVEAARAAQLALAAHRWPHDEAVKVRIGVHTGSPRVRDGNYWGVDVHYAARLSAAAHGGQVLISASTRALVPDVAAEDLGEHALKDFPSARRIFHLPVGGLDSRHFAPLKASRAGRTNLPDQVSTFVGRDGDLATLHELVAHTRMVTLTGAGGVGKTRLALRLGSELLDGSKDGVWFVDLASVVDPGLVGVTTAAVFELPERPGESVLDALSRALADRELLIVLDNCEHVIATAAPLVSELLMRCPGLSVLATSREPLRVAGEQVYRVPSLSLPAEADEDPEQLAQFEAVRLFLERARQQRRDFVLDHDNAALVGRVCRRLDGIPLAIELAAVRLRSLSIRDLDARLDQRFALLKAGTRTALPRQQTLHALIDWSYQLLSETERAVLARLSIFAASGFALDAAEAVCASSEVDPLEVLDLVDELVNKSLVHAEDTAGSVRYRLPETVRAYAGEKLTDRQAMSARAAHRDFYLEFAETAAPNLRGPDATNWYAHLEAEHDNLRLALSYSLVDPDPDLGLRLGSALYQFWRARGHAAEGSRALERQLARPDAGQPTPLRGYALVARGRLLGESLADFRAGQLLCEEGLRIAQRQRADRLAAEALAGLIWTHHRKGEVARSLELNEQGTALAHSLGDQYLIAAFALGRGAALSSQGQDPLPAFQEALRVSGLHGNKSMGAIALDNIALVELMDGDARSARLRFEQASRWWSEARDPSQAAWTSVGLGLADYIEADVVGAAQRFSETLETGSRLGDVEMIALSLLGLALADGDPDAAATLHGAADSLAAQIGLRIDPLESRLRSAAHARLRTTIGDERFQRAYVSGGELSRSDAIALGRRRGAGT